MLVAVVSLISLINVRKGPGGVDCWYHMAVAKKILDIRSVPLYADWELYPVGRPHLYPPLLHLLVAVASAPTGNTFVGGKVINSLMPFISLSLTLFALRKLYRNSWRELVVLLLLVMDPIFLKTHHSLLPSVLASSLALPALAYFINRRPIRAALFMTASLYTHLGVPYLFILGLLVFSVVRRDYFRVYLKFVAISFLFFLPWAVHVLANFDWIRVTAWLPRAEHALALSLTVVLGLIGCWIAIKKRERQDLLAMACLVGFIPAFLLYGARFWFHSSVVWAMLASKPLALLRRRHRDIALIALCALTIIPQPAFVVGGAGRGEGFHLIPSGLSGEIAMVRSEDYSKYRVDVGLIVQGLDTHFPELEVVFTNSGWVGEMFYALTGRKTNLAMYGEVMSSEVIEPRLEAMKTVRPAVFVFVRGMGYFQFLEDVEDVLEVGRFYVGVRT